MADPYEDCESEDMPSFLQILLHNSSSSAATTDSAASAAASGLLCAGGPPASVAEHSSSINYSDLIGFLAKETDGINPSTSVKSMVSSCEVYLIKGYCGQKRRSRINEKLKALQSLIPNSNKTGKASMLDEAIEYLKQLQLQVQMLTLRNRLSSRPGYSLGSLQSMLVAPARLELDEGNGFPNANRATDTLSMDERFSLQSAMAETINHSSSTQRMLMTSMANTTNSVILPSVVPLTQKHYGLLNHLGSASKDDTFSRLLLDISCPGNNSSPGVSSSSYKQIGRRCALNCSWIYEYERVMFRGLRNCELTTSSAEAY